MDSTKLKGILDWPTPKTIKEVQSLLGFGNFYHHFVKGFSHLTHPLHDLLKKDKKFVWSEECQESFDQLKKRFTEEPVLMMPDHPNLSKYKLILRYSPQEVSLVKWIPMETDILVPIFSKA
jgi:hypothetical protein